MPLVGRAFQSKVTQLERKNVMMFVTVRLLDPGGNPVNQSGVTAATASAP
jgi:general secretion pathway protein D